MPTLLISYDLKETPKDIHTNVKQTMMGRGYSDVCEGKKKLPNTCLHHSNKTIDQSIIDLTNVVRQFNGTLEKYVSVIISSSKCDQLVF